MKILRALRDINFENGILEKGEVTFTNESNRIVQGRFINEIIHGYDCEFVDVVGMNQELLQRREEVAELMKQRDKWKYEHDQTRKAYEHYFKESRGLNKEILALQESLEMVRSDRQKILRRMEQDVKQEKVVLPRDVAEAIGSKRPEAKNFDFLDCVNRALRSGVYWNKNEEAIADWLRAEFTRKDILVQALVNGYTVEPEPEKTPKEKAIQHCIKHGLVARGKSEHDVVSAIMNILEKN